ncbi:MULTISPECIES: hypothetical protein [unclassified Crossiella]|uniref:hypothetical protein n=1 Tax=unclassified Crossiella TaxID=2620835 RepID=UPI0024951BB6|nr:MULTISPECIES: hypothetical protein [unclassified Crossiella]
MSEHGRPQAFDERQIYHWNGGSFRIGPEGVLKLGAAVRHVSENIYVNVANMSAKLRFEPELRFPASGILMEVVQQKLVTGTGSLVNQIKRYALVTLGDAVEKLKETARESKFTEDAITQGFGKKPEDLPDLPQLNLIDRLVPAETFGIPGAINEDLLRGLRLPGIAPELKVQFLQQQSPESSSHLHVVADAMEKLLEESDAVLRTYATRLGGEWVSEASDLAQSSIRQHSARAAELSGNAQTAAGLFRGHQNAAQEASNKGEMIAERLANLWLITDPVKKEEERRQLDQDATAALESYLAASQRMVSQLPYASPPADPDRLKAEELRSDSDDSVRTTTTTHHGVRGRGGDSGEPGFGNRPPHDPPLLRPPVTPPPVLPPPPGGFDQVDPSLVQPTLPGGGAGGPGFPQPGGVGGGPGLGGGLTGGLVGGMLGGGLGAVGGYGAGAGRGAGTTPSPGGRAGVGAGPAGLPGAPRPGVAGAGPGSHLPSPPPTGGAGRGDEEDKEHKRRYGQPSDEFFALDPGPPPAPRVIGGGERSRFYASGHSDPEES